MPGSNCFSLALAKRLGFIEGMNFFEKPKTAQDLARLSLSDARATLRTIETLLAQHERALIDAPLNWAVALASNDLAHELKTFAYRVGA